MPELVNKRQADRDIAFGGKIYKSVLLDFVEDIAYVDFVTDFKLYSFRDTAGKTISDVNEIQPETPDTILVSSQTHSVKEVV